MKPRFNIATERARLRAAKAKLRQLRDADPGEYRRMTAALREGTPFLSKALGADIRHLWRGFSPDQFTAVKNNQPHEKND